MKVEDFLLQYLQCKKAFINPRENGQIKCAVCTWHNVRLFVRFVLLHNLRFVIGTLKQFLFSTVKSVIFRFTANPNWVICTIHMQTNLNYF